MSRAYQRPSHLINLPYVFPIPVKCHFYPYQRIFRPFSASRRVREDRHQHQHQHDYQHPRPSFLSRLRAALRNTKVAWYPIPVGLGISFLGFAQVYRVRQREKLRLEDEARHITQGEANGEPHSGRPKRRERIRPSGPWLVASHM